jgi:hypothetical protein
MRHKIVDVRFPVLKVLTEVCCIAGRDDLQSGTSGTKFRSKLLPSLPGHIAPYARKLSEVQVKECRKTSN